MSEDWPVPKADLVPVPPETWEDTITEPLHAEVIGMPVPQGSKRVVHGHLIDVNHDKLRDWRRLVGEQAATEERFFQGPIMVDLAFYLPRPKGHFGTGRNAGVLKPSAPRYPESKPDIDKLVRACLDAMTGMVFRDDSQVAMLVARKLYADDRYPGVVIEIEERR
jgi:crossover junction endodeoxyribonuclease RusA